MAQNLNVQTTDQFLYYPNTDKILKRLMYNRFYSFLEKKNLHILSNLVSNSTIQLLVLQMKSEMKLTKGNYACGLSKGI